MKRDSAIEVVKSVICEVSTEAGTGGKEVSCLNELLAELETGKGRPEEIVIKAQEIRASVHRAHRSGSRGTESFLRGMIG